MTDTNSTPTVDPEAFRTRHRRFAAEALMLRTQHLYRQNWEKRFAVEDPEPNSFETLTERYTQLLNDWASDGPEDAAGVAAYVDLVMAIIEGAIAFRYFDHAAPPISVEREMLYALELLASASRWLNVVAINEEVDHQLGKRAKGAGA